MNFKLSVKIFISLFLIAGCTTIRYNIPNIDDYEIFPARVIETDLKIPTHTFTLDTGHFMDFEEWGMGKHADKGQSEVEFFSQSGTIALLVLQNDTILYQWFAKGYNNRQTYTPFSMAKAFVSTLIGIAIEEKKIQSVHQPIADFLPAFTKDSTLKLVTFHHLLQMTSGLRSGEREGISPGLYYGKDILKRLENIHAKHLPGKRFKYQNLNTQLLAMALEKATGKTISAYLEEKIWQPLGMEANASWSLDHKGGTEKAFCCLNAHLYDYARFGLLMLRKGEWNGQQIVPKEWIDSATQLDMRNGSKASYQYHWYTSAEQEDFFAEGLYGQYLYISPQTNRVVVRLGKGVHLKDPWYEMFKVLAGLRKKPRPVTLTQTQLKLLEGEYTFGVSERGDSTMLGRKAFVNRKGNILHIRGEGFKAFDAIPTNDSTFYNLKWGRKLHFQRDRDGIATSIKWNRRGFRWQLKRAWD